MSVFRSLFVATCPGDIIQFHRTGCIRWYLSIAVLLQVCLGCTPYYSSVDRDELPLKPLPSMGGAGDIGLAGRQGASLQLTVEGREQLRSGRLDEAISKFQKAISLSSSNPYAYYFFGEARYLKQEYEQSLSLLERAEQYSVDDPVWLARVHVLRGKNYEALSHYEEAKDNYQEALDNDPYNPEAKEGIHRLQEDPGQE
jgi:tetratricopeptide (TPR) repeat protein